MLGNMGHSGPMSHLQCAVLSRDENNEKKKEMSPYKNSRASSHTNGSAANTPYSHAIIV